MSEPTFFLGEQVTLAGTTHKTALGQPSFRQRVADQILEVDINIRSFFKEGKNYMSCYLVSKLTEYLCSGVRTNSQFGTTPSRMSSTMKVELLRLLFSAQEITFAKQKTNLSGASHN